MMKAYLIRGQASGVNHGRVYLAWPTEEQLREALAAELRMHGFDKDGKPKRRWVMVQETELVGPNVPGLVGLAGKPLDAVDRLMGVLTEEEVKNRVASGPTGSGLAIAGDVIASGTGTVSNPK